MAENRCIGRDNGLPWHIPADLKRFRTLTLGKPVIMGRKTFESIVERLGKPLPGRTNIVVGRTAPPAPQTDADGWETLPARTIEEALEIARKQAATRNLDEIIIGGGALIYEQTLPFTDRLYLTEIRQTVEGDAFFPALDAAQWRETAREDLTGPPAFSWLTLDRIAG